MDSTTFLLLPSTASGKHTRTPSTNSSTTSLSPPSQRILVYPIPATVSVSGDSSIYKSTTSLPLTTSSPTTSAKAPFAIRNPLSDSRHGPYLREGRRRSSSSSIRRLISRVTRHHLRSRTSTNSGSGNSSESSPTRHLSLAQSGSRPSTISLGKRPRTHSPTAVKAAFKSLSDAHFSAHNKYTEPRPVTPVAGPSTRSSVTEMCAQAIHDRRVREGRAGMEEPDLPHLTTMAAAARARENTRARERERDLERDWSHMNEADVLLELEFRLQRVGSGLDRLGGVGWETREGTGKWKLREDYPDDHDDATASAAVPGTNGGGDHQGEQPAFGTGTRTRIRTRNQARASAERFRQAMKQWRRTRELARLGKTTAMLRSRIWKIYHVVLEVMRTDHSGRRAKTNKPSSKKKSLRTLWSGEPAASSSPSATATTKIDKTSRILSLLQLRLRRKLPLLRRLVYDLETAMGDLEWLCLLLWNSEIRRWRAVVAAGWEADADADGDGDDNVGVDIGVGFGCHDGTLYNGQGMLGRETGTGSKKTMHLDDGDVERCRGLNARISGLQVRCDGILWELKRS